MRKEFNYYEYKASLTQKPTFKMREPKERDPKTMLLIDPKSKEPRNEQIARQIAQFTKNDKVGLKDVVSIDDFVDLVDIEKEFGSIQMGGEVEDEDLKIMAMFSPFQLRPINKFWF